MMCYKDQTFCTAQCRNDQCDLRLTLNVLARAESLGLWVAQGDRSQGCNGYQPITLPPSANR